MPPITGQAAPTKETHRDHLDLRDYLRTHPAECQRYAALKQTLAPLLATDREAYLTGKADLVTELLERARNLPAIHLP